MTAEAKDADDRRASVASYTNAWQDYRRRTWILWGTFLLLPPIGLGLGAVLKGVTTSTEAPNEIIGFLLMIPVWMLVGLWAGTWQCPRCRREYFSSPERGYNYLTKQCLHCGLPKWSTDSAA